MKHQEIQGISTEPTYEYMTVDGSWVRLRPNGSGTAVVAEIERIGQDGKPLSIYEVNWEFTSIDEAMALLAHDLGYVREGENPTQIHADARRFVGARTLRVYGDQTTPRLRLFPKEKYC